MNEVYISGTLPILALRGLAIFPDQSFHFDIGRTKSALALEAAMKNDQILLLVPQKNILDDDPELGDLFAIGTVAKVKQILKTHGDNIRVLVKGLYRAKISSLKQFTPYLSGNVEKVDVQDYKDTLRTKALCRDAKALYGQYSDLLEHPVQGVLPSEGLAILRPVPAERAADPALRGGLRRHPVLREDRQRLELAAEGGGLHPGGERDLSAAVS